MDEESEQISISKSLASDCCLTFTQFCTNLSLALFIKMLLIKKLVFSVNQDEILNNITFFIYFSLKAKNG